MRWQTIYLYLMRCNNHSGVKKKEIRVFGFESLPLVSLEDGAHWSSSSEFRIPLQYISAFRVGRVLRSCEGRTSCSASFTALVRLFSGLWLSVTVRSVSIFCQNRCFQRGLTNLFKLFHWSMEFGKGVGWIGKLENNR